MSIVTTSGAAKHLKAIGGKTPAARSAMRILHDLVGALSETAYSSPWMLLCGCQKLTAQSSAAQGEILRHPGPCSLTPWNQRQPTAPRKAARAQAGGVRLHAGASPHGSVRHSSALPRAARSASASRLRCFRSSAARSLRASCAIAGTIIA